LRLQVWWSVIDTFTMPAPDEHGKAGPHATGGTPGQAGALGERASGRLRCTMARCTLGEIIDISAGGMKIRTRARPALGKGVQTLLLTQHGQLPVRCTVRWTKRVSLFWFDVGLRFSELSPEARRVICEFAGGIAPPAGSAGGGGAWNPSRVKRLRWVA
jgi:hypothetical protein